MAYAVVHEFAGATKEQYEASLAAVHPSDGSLPAGGIYHVAGPSANGWAIFALFDARESWERFRDETLGPAMAAGLDGGFTGPPSETSFEVDTEIRS